MNYSYKKLYNKNYLVLDQFDTPLLVNDYKLEMIKRNSIEGLLNMQLYIEDNLPSFYYSITGLHSFYSHFYDNKLKRIHIVNFFTCLHNTLLNLRKYLLDYDHMVLIPQCIFFDNDLTSFNFCYCPNHTTDFFSALKEFIAYLLSITDHDDEKTVLISYALWQETQNENFNLSSLIAIIEKHSEHIEKVSEVTDGIVHAAPIEPVDTVNDCKDINILKEPDILLKENYIYKSGFLIKNILIFSVASLALIINIILKLIGFYSTELFFIILISIIIFCIFHVSNVIHDAPLYRIYDNSKDNEPIDIIKINTNINVSSNNLTETNIDDSDDNNETVLLCVNPNIKNKRLIYTGMDFSQECELNNFPFTIGKKNDNTMIIDNPLISRCHARIILQNGKYYIEDLNSSNGTKVNDCIIPSFTLTEINLDDNITFADLTYIFQ